MLGSLFNKVADLQTCNFIKKRLQHRRFPVNIAKFLRTPLSKNICKRLPLNIITKLVSNYISDFISNCPITYNLWNTCYWLLLLIAEWQMRSYDINYMTKILLISRGFVIDVTFLYNCFFQNLLWRRRKNPVFSKLS